MAKTSSLVELPEEVLTIVCTHLDHSDLKSIRLTCKKFYKASMRAALIDKEQFIFDGYFYDPKNFTDHLKNASTRKFYHFTFKCLEINDELNQILDQQGTFIRSLSFLFCGINAGCFKKILERCIDLEELTLEKCSDFYDFELAEPIQLTSLRIFSFGCTHITDDIFNKYTQMAPNFKNLDLRYTWLNFNHAILMKFYPGIINVSDEENYVFNSTQILHFRNVLHFLRKDNNSGRIRIINLSDTKIDDRSLRLLSDVQFAHLEVLSLCGCIELHGKSLEYIVRKQNRLRELYLSKTKCNDGTLKTITEVLSNTLIKLHINACSQITIKGVSHVAAIQSLRELEASEIQKSDGIYFNIENLNIKKLVLNVHHFKFHNLINVLNNIKNVTTLKLQGHPRSATNQILYLIATHMKNLKSLTLDPSFSLTYDDFECDFAVRDGLDTVFLTGLDNSFKDLEELYLMHSCLRDYGVQCLLKKPKLKKLSLINPQVCSRREFLSISVNTPGLVYLGVYNVYIDKDAVLKVVTSLKKLETFILEVCPMTFDITLFANSSGLLRRVKINEEWYVRTSLDANFYKRNTILNYLFVL